MTITLPTNLKNDNDRRSDDFCDSFCEALHKGSTDSIRETLVDKKEKLNEEDPCGFIPLHFVIQRGCDVEIVKVLVDAGADVNLKNSDGNTPLHLAFEINNDEMAEVLITAGGHLDTKNQEGDTVLHIAMRRCSLCLAKSMFDSGADINSKSSDGKTLLHFAASGCNNPVIEYLISRGLDVNAKDDHDQTPLHSVADLGLFGIGGLDDSLDAVKYDSRSTTVEILLKNDADPTVLNSQGDTPLQTIAKTWNDRILELVLEYMIKPYVKNNEKEEAKVQ